MPTFIFHSRRLEGDAGRNETAVGSYRGHIVSWPNSRAAEKYHELHIQENPFEIAAQLTRTSVYGIGAKTISTQTLTFAVVTFAQGSAVFQAQLQLPVAP